MILSAQLATATRNCAAESCEGEAEHNSRLCFRCLRKDDVKLHEPPQQQHEPSLRCSTCSRFKPDTQFSKSCTSHARRGHSSECKECANQRRRKERATTPRQRCAAINQGARGRHPGEQCRSIALLNTPYCGTHKDLA